MVGLQAFGSLAEALQGLPCEEGQNDSFRNGLEALIYNAARDDARFLRSVRAACTRPRSTWPQVLQQGNGTMYGLIGKITTTPGRRDDLIAILLEGTAGMPGCLSYVVARDSTDANAIWVTEVWDTKASHTASLSLPSVRAAIAKGRPLIAAFSDRVETAPVGGVGLDRNQP